MTYSIKCIISVIIGFAISCLLLGFYHIILGLGIGTSCILSLFSLIAFDICTYTFKKINAKYRS